MLKGVVTTCNYKVAEYFNTNSEVCYNVTELHVVHLRNFSLLQYQNLEQLCKGNSKVLRFTQITEGMFNCYQQSDCLLLGVFMLMNIYTLYF